MCCARVTPDGFYCTRVALGGSYGRVVLAVTSVMYVTELFSSLGTWHAAFVISSSFKGALSDLWASDFNVKAYILWLSSHFSLLTNNVLRTTHASVLYSTGLDAYSTFITDFNSFQHVSEHNAIFSRLLFLNNWETGTIMSIYTKYGAALAVRVWHGTHGCGIKPHLTRLFCERDFMKLKAAVNPRAKHAKWVI